MATYTPQQAYDRARELHDVASWEAIGKDLGTDAAGAQAIYSGGSPTANQSISQATRDQVLGSWNNFSISNLMQQTGLGEQQLRDIAGGGGVAPAGQGIMPFSSADYNRIQANSQAQLAGGGGIIAKPSMDTSGRPSFDYLGNPLTAGAPGAVPRPAVPQITSSAAGVPPAGTFNPNPSGPQTGGFSPATPRVDQNKPTVDPNLLQFLPTDTPESYKARLAGVYNNPLSQQAAREGGIAPSYGATPAFGGTQSVGASFGQATGGAPVVPFTGSPESDTAIAKLTADVQAVLRLSPEQLNTQADLDRLVESFKKGYQNIEDQPIALDFITGQQQSLEKRALGLAEPLEKKLARLQAERVAALDASKFALERADRTAEQQREDASTAASRAEQTRQFNVSEARLGSKETSLNTQIVNVGGRMLLVNQDTGATIKDLGASTSTTNPPSVTDQKYYQDQQIQKALPAAIQKAGDELGRNVGQDGYTDPGVYIGLRDDWVSAGFGTAASFDNQFAVRLSPQERARLGVGKAAGVSAGEEEGA